MSLRHLRRIRIVVSTIFLLAVTALFLNVGRRIPPVVEEFLVSLQIVPGFIKLFTAVGISAIGIAVIVVSTVLFGRLYCSSICPLGTFQDAIIFVSKRIRGKRSFRYRRNNDILHYSVLAIAILFGAGGSLLVLNILDPFSTFGRIVANFVRPFETFLNNCAASVLNAAGIYSLYQIPSPGADLSVIGLSFILLALVVILSFEQGRLFCNLLCPVGAMLKLLSKFSLFRMVIDGSACKDCTLCEKVCKASCIDSRSHRIDFGSCIGCFDCIHACPTVGIVYECSRRTLSVTPNRVEDPGRRKVVESIGSALVLLGGSFVAGNGLRDTVKAPHARRKYPVTPPGSISVRRFSQLCTACHLCVSACPMQVITPSLLGYGFRGIFQPSLNYSTGYCKYDCNICGQICPSGAITPVGVEQKKEIQLGKAQFVKEDCIVVTKKTECGACSEHCPTKAVTMVPYERLLLPELNNEICVGCGACEHACPTKPAKAIYVESNEVHQRAKKPVIKKLERDVAPKDFPF